MKKGKKINIKEIIELVKYYLETFVWDSSIKRSKLEEIMENRRALNNLVLKKLKEKYGE